MSPSGVPSALARVPEGSKSPSGVPIALKGVVILKTLIQIDGAIGADDLHLAHDIPYALGSVRCVV